MNIVILPATLITALKMQNLELCKRGGGGEFDIPLCIFHFICHCS